MVSFNKLFTSVFLAVVYASTALASPASPSSKHTTPLSSAHTSRRAVHVSRDLTLEVFHPEPTFETFGAGIDHPLSKRDDPSTKDVAIAFVQSRLGIDPSTIEFHSSFTGDVAKHAYVKQTHAGIPFANAVANVAMTLDNKVVSFGSSFVKPDKIASSTPTITVEEATSTAERALFGTFNNHPPTIEYLVKADNTVALTHVIQIQNVNAGVFVAAYVDAHSGELLSIADFTAKSSYLVLPITKEILTQGFETLTDPQDLTASPDGWHSDGTTSTTVTAGNNAIAFKGSQSATTSQSSAVLNFIYPQNPATDPTTTANVNAARTNAFYIVNTIHDITYKYGFTEAAFNFQNNNFGKGGVGNDRVTVSVQDSGGTDNADFSTPPDGQSGAMRMFLWDLTSPRRDGALENDIVAHENTHGLTNRMTGGGTATCLRTLEAGGLGEGWSDAFAEWTEHTDASVPDYVLGQYVTNNPAGIRTHPYSTSMTTNPLTYASIANLNEVHNIGEVWANMLHNVYAGLVGVHGFSTTARTDPTGTAGNVVFLHLFIDALPIQPCNPTLPTARDAWIQADVNRFAGANKCTLWRAFASRGLGVGAANHVNSFAVPAGC